jgi:2-amino-4-hydroxy-6-hydroxymethyldihydropteridine diphosphokinase
MATPSTTPVRGEARGRRRVRAYLGLGANLGDAAATLEKAVATLAARPGLAVRAVSRLYATAPWGVIDQPEFRNAAVALDVTTPRDTDPETAALDLLGRLKSIEREAGRIPGQRWGPRALDLDLLVFGRHRIDVPRTDAARSVEADEDPAKAARRLQVPHRDLGERLFVLAPLADVAPRLVPPGWHETIQTRRDAVAATGAPDAVRVVGRWDARTGRWR